MSAFNSDLRDLKLFQVRETFSAPVGAGTYEHLSPPNRICWLDSLRVQLSTNTNIIADGLTVDDQTLVRGNATSSNNTFRLGRLWDWRQYTSGSVSTELSTRPLMTPFRRHIKIGFNNAGVGAEGQTIDLWLWIHQDSVMEFRAEAGMQGG